MRLNILTFIIINYISITLAIEIYQYEDYLEYDKNNVLHGHFTPIFVAKLNSTNVTYDHAYYPKSGEKVVYFNTETPKRKDYYSYTYSEVENEIENSAPEDKRDKRENIEKQQIVYPEIFVVVDYETYVAHNKNVSSIATYMAAFWNGVDLRFRQMKEPEVRLNIAGLVIISDPEIEKHLFKGLPDESMRSTLDHISKYFIERFHGYYDVLVYMKYWPQDDEGEKRIGYSFFQGVCHDHYSSILMRDAGGFEGIITAAHRLGFLFGAPHDGKQSTEIFGGPCSEVDRYMMSPLWGSENKIHWSKCSILAMQDHLSSVNCIKNKPDIIPHQKKLPGKLLSRNEQCNRMLPGLLSIDNEQCSLLDCGISCSLVSYFCQEQGNYLIPPAEGSSCGDGRFCLDGKCVEDTGIYD